MGSTIITGVYSLSKDPQLSEGSILASGYNVFIASGTCPGDGVGDSVGDGVGDGVLGDSVGDGAVGGVGDSVLGDSVGDGDGDGDGMLTVNMVMVMAVPAKAGKIGFIPKARECERICF